MVLCQRNVIRHTNSEMCRFRWRRSGIVACRYHVMSHSQLSSSSFRTPDILIAYQILICSCTNVLLSHDIISCHQASHNQICYWNFTTVYLFINSMVFFYSTIYIIPNRYIHGSHLVFFAVTSTQLILLKSCSITMVQSVPANQPFWIYIYIYKYIYSTQTTMIYGYFNNSITTHSNMRIFHETYCIYSAP